jgi:hypothetical protein
LEGARCEASAKRIIGARESKGSGVIERFSNPRD